tara:strand:- start:196 stop:774 length:579 start_codon:yes stop_codon:yes gene_type:complete
MIKCSFVTFTGATFLVAQLNRVSGVINTVLTIANKILRLTVSLKELTKTKSSTTKGGSMWQMSALLGIGLIVMSGAFKLYYDKAEAQKETMAAELRQAANNELLLENSIKQLNNQVIQAEEDKQKAFEKINVLQEQNNQAREEVSKLKSKFDKHDMNMLSLRKPKLIENIINKGTKEVLGEFESITSPTANL